MADATRSRFAVHILLFSLRTSEGAMLHVHTPHAAGRVTAAATKIATNTTSTSARNHATSRFCHTKFRFSNVQTVPTHHSPS
jgi:hypothetical protein